MEYTKGELKVSSSFLIVTPEAQIVANTQPVGVSSLDLPFEEAIANAARLVKCWNSHDDLVDVCKEIKKALDNCPGVFNYDPKIEDRLSQAIAKAEKE